MAYRRNFIDREMSRPNYNYLATCEELFDSLGKWNLPLGSRIILSGMDVDGYLWALDDELYLAECIDPDETFDPQYGESPFDACFDTLQQATEYIKTYIEPNVDIMTDDEWDLLDLTRNY